MAIKSRELLGKITFSNSEVLVSGVNVYMLPINTFLVFSEVFRESTLSIEQLMYSVGIFEGKLLFASFGKAYGRARQGPINMLCEFMEVCGFGEFNILYMNEKKHSVKIQGSSSLALQQLRTKGRLKYPVDQYLLGIFCGFFEGFWSLELKGNESRCMAKGAGACVFELEPGSIPSPEDNLVKSIGASEDFLYSNRGKEAIKSPLVQMVLSGNHVQKDGCIIKVWNISVVLVPAGTLLALQKCIRAWQGKDMEMAFYYIGKIQAKSGAEIQMKLFGRKNDEKLYLSMLQQADLLGFGAIQLKSFSYKRSTASIRLDNASYERHNRLIFSDSDPAGLYFCGLIVGVSCAFFKKDVDCQITGKKQGYTMTYELKPSEKLPPTGLKKLLDAQLTAKGFLT